MKSWSKSFRDRVERRRKDERIRRYWLSRAVEIMGPELAPFITLKPSSEIRFRGLKLPR